MQLLFIQDPLIDEAITEEAEHVSGILNGLWNAIRDALPSLAFAAAVFFIGILLVKILMKFIGHTIKKSNIDPTASGFLLSLIRVVMLLLVTVIGLTVLNVPMTSIVTVIGTAGLAIGLALQDSLANVAGGFIVLFTKPLKVQDFVKIDSITGTVEGIGILQTKLLQPDGTTVYIPNGKIADAVILNYSEHALRRLDLSFSIDYHNNAETAKQLILDILAQNSRALPDPPPLVRIGNFGDNAVELHVRVWTSCDAYWDLYYDLHEQIKSAFDEQGISIPFPQLDVHLDK